MYFVFAAHNVTPSTFSVNEDVGYIYNITINNTDVGEAANITEVNITLSSGLVFRPGDNNTNALATFINVSNVLSWKNATHSLINGSGYANQFWFNATAATPGTYIITVTRLNVTGAFSTNITVTVNDTTPPSAVTFNTPTEADSTYITQSYIMYNVSATDNGNLSTIIVRLYNSSNNLINSSTSSSSPFLGNFSGLGYGTYKLTAAANDTYGNTNATTANRTYTLKSYWVFNGTIRNVTGSALNYTLVNVTIWTMGAQGPSLNNSVSARASLTGAFSMRVPGDSSWMYKPIIRHTDPNTSALDYIGQSLPEFSYMEFANKSDINFYLKEAGTINITAINRTGTRISFRYQVKDVALGYPIESQFNSAVNEAVVYVQRDRNYSVMIYPDQAIPVSLNWNNFSSVSYNISIDGGNTNISQYNATTHILQKTFNCTDNLIRVLGYIQTSTASTSNWTEFTVVPFLLEPGNMVYLGENAGMPYNMSAWMGQSDTYNLSSGNYSITLPGPAESATYLLFATARNSTGYYGGYTNITLGYGSSNSTANFTMHPLMSTNWAAPNNNITLNDAVAWARVNISSAKQRFRLVNSTSALSNVNAHLEIKVDYSSYGAREFTFMTDISSGDASVYLPLLNASVKEMNVYSQSYSPKNIQTRTAAQILNNSNITMSSFNPGDIDGADIMDSVQVALYQSNSTCNLPNPDTACILADSATMDPDSEAHFNPLNSIIGGGKINFRMGLISSGIIVEYINVDMLASGPPDALFDDSATTQTSGSFDSAMRFGSNGPKIYDYVIISMPYTQGSTSQTGLDESADVNMSIPILYDETWGIMWNATLNGTNGTALARNYSHYNTYSSEWEILMRQNNCTKNQSFFNSTTPCYIDTTNNRTWIRLPHFSGTGPSVTGGVITASSSDTGGGGSSGGGGTTGTTYSVTAGELASGYSKSIAKGDKFKFTIVNETHYVTLTSLTSTTATINVSSASQPATLSVGEEKKFELTNDTYYDLSVKLNSINITSNKTSLTIKSIHEEISATACTPSWSCGNWSTCATGAQTRTCTDANNCGTSANKPAESQTCTTRTREPRNLLWLWILIIVVVVVIALVIIFVMKKKRYYSKGR